MIKNILLCTLIICAYALIVYPSEARADTQSINAPIVVELFTSQGCPACPPADDIMNKLATNPKVISLSYHVQYWDRPNRKDILGRAFSDDRQRRYADYSRSKRLYTPQMMVNGGAAFIGSHKEKVVEALRAAKPLEPITITAVTGDSATLSLPQLDNGFYTLWIAGVKAKHIETNARGQSRIFTNSVLSLKTGDPWDGNANITSVTLDKNPDIDHYIILAQNQAHGEIVAVGMLEF